MRDCTVSHCFRPTASKGYCAAHYQQVYRGRDPEQLRLEAADPRDCAVLECDTTVWSGLVCVKHKRQIAMGAIDAPAGVTLQANPLCEFDGCDRLAAYKRGGLCRSHIAMLERDGELGPLQFRSGSPCREQWCQLASVTKGLCAEHYGASRRPASSPMTPCGTRGCPRRTRSKSGHCSIHAAQIAQWGVSWMPGERDSVRERCLVSWCDLPAFRNELCPTHRARVNGHRISAETFARLFEDPKCHACGSTDGLCIDHDHGHCPGERGCDECVRALLCRSCNFALGQVRESATRLRQLADYAEQWLAA